MDTCARVGVGTGTGLCSCRILLGSSCTDILGIRLKAI